MQFRILEVNVNIHETMQCIHLKHVVTFQTLHWSIYVYDKGSGEWDKIPCSINFDRYKLIPYIETPNSWIINALSKQVGTFLCDDEWCHLSFAIHPYTMHLPVLNSFPRSEPYCWDWIEDIQIINSDNTYVRYLLIQKI